MVGIDSLNCPLAGIVMVAACGYGSTPLGLFTVIIPCAPMFLSSWEQYHTGILYLGYFNGPCEGIIIACTIMGFAATYGPGFYHQRAIDTIGWPFTVESTMMYDLFVWMCLIALFAIQVPSWYLHPPATFVEQSVYNVYVARKSRRQPLLPTFPQLAPIIIFFAAHYAWLLSPYSHILENGGLMRVGLTMTFVFGRMTTKIILVLPSSIPELTAGPSYKTRFPVFHKSNNTSRPSRCYNQSSFPHTLVVPFCVWLTVVIRL